jgi:acyl carrier protein
MAQGRSESAALTRDVIRARLRDHILGTYLFTDDPAALGDDDSFQDTRIIDSMGMMQLVQFVESEFGVALRDLDLVPEKLDSVNRLAASIHARLDQRDGRSDARAS